MCVCVCVYIYIYIYIHTHTFEPSFFSRTGYFPWVFDGFLERRIPGMGKVLLESRMPEERLINLIRLRIDDLRAKKAQVSMRLWLPCQRLNTLWNEASMIPGQEGIRITRGLLHPHLAGSEVQEPRAFSPLAPLRPPSATHSARPNLARGARFFAQAGAARAPSPEKLRAVGIADSAGRPLEPMAEQRRSKGSSRGDPFCPFSAHDRAAKGGMRVLRSTSMPSGSP